MKRPPPRTGRSVALNSAWLRNRIAELGLKQWWLAEQLRVDKKSVSRWLQGRVRVVQRSRAEALAAVLACRVEDFERAGGTIDLASADDQRAAGALLSSGLLIDKLGPVGDWDVVEALVKAVAVPDLPVHVLGELYHQLCVASWRQDKLDAAGRFNDATFEMAERCGDRRLLALAHSSRANLLHWRGQCGLAIEHFRHALALERHLDADAIGSVQSNLGASLYEIGEVEAGRAMLRQALARLRLGGLPMRLSIVHGHLAMLALRCGDDLDSARRELEASIACADQAGYRRGAAMGLLLRAEWAARSGDAAMAASDLQRSLAAFAEQGIDEGLNHEFAARVLRLLGRADEALPVLQRGLQVAGAFPLEAAGLHHELARLHRERGDAAAAHRSAAAAAALYRQCGAPRMADAAAGAAGEDGEARADAAACADGAAGALAQALAHVP